MPVTAIKKLLVHRHLTGRDYGALVLLVIVLSSFASTWIQYRHSQEALRIAQDARLRLRADRKTTERELCNAVNLNRAINDRDRATLLAGVRQTKRDLKVVTDPVLHALLLRSLKQSQHEVAIRPRLVPLNCTKLVNKPGQVKVPPKVPPTVTTG